MKLKNILIALFGINLVITVHEFGHWSMAHLFGVETPIFSIGFGPTIFSQKIGTTNFELAILPFGGYVEIAGMRHAEVGKEKTSFIYQPFWHKVLIMLGGIFYNIIFAFLIFIIVGLAPSSQAQAVEKTRARNLIGPIGIISIISRSYQYGWNFYWDTLAILSLNLAIFNLLPLPILDGGQLLIQTIEYAQKAQLSDSTYEMIMMITLFFMLFLFLRITRQDIKNPV